MTELEIKLGSQDPEVPSMSVHRRLTLRFTLSFLIGLIAIASLGLWAFSMWERTRPNLLGRTLATGVRVMATRDIMDSLWVPTDSELLRRAGRVEIQGIPFTDDDLSQLAAQANPEVLVLVGTQVTDAGLAHLKRMTMLRWLDLQDSQVSDVGLEALEGMTNLRGVALRGSRVTPSAISALRNTAPEMKIMN